MKVFVASQFGYRPLVWMFHNQGLIQPRFDSGHRFWARENWRPKKHFPVKNKPVSVTKRPLFTSKLAFYSFLEVFRANKWSKNLIFLSFLALALASGATRPRLGVSEHPPNPQFQGLKIDSCGYRRPNYFSRSAPDNRGFNNKITSLHERALRVTYGDKSSSFQHVLRKSNSVSTQNF